MEEWRDIKGFEGWYQVSNMGNVRSLDRFIDYKNRKGRVYKGQILKPHVETLGYLSVSLTKNRKRIYARIHRLVADTFMTNEEHKAEVNHIDGNKWNNAVSNLQYSTHSENMQHAVKTGLKKRAYAVRMIDLKSGETLKTFPSMHSAAVYLNEKSVSKIYRCVNGKANEACGYAWELVNPLNSR